MALRLVVLELADRIFIMGGHVPGMVTSSRAYFDRLPQIWQIKSSRSISGAPGCPDSGKKSRVCRAGHRSAVAGKKPIWRGGAAKIYLRSRRHNCGPER
jgi:hypothetical protein